MDACSNCCRSSGSPPTRRSRSSSLTLCSAASAGLVLGLGLYTTRAGSLLANRAVFGILNVLVNFFRPIPFIIFMAAVQPLARLVVGTGIGNNALIFALSLAAAFAHQADRRAEPADRAARRHRGGQAMGAGPMRIILTLVIPEALGPLILGYTFMFVAIVDMSAVAGFIGGGGLGNFAIEYGYRQFKPVVTWAAVLMIIVVRAARAVLRQLARPEGAAAVARAPVSEARRAVGVAVRAQLILHDRGVRWFAPDDDA